MLVRFCIQIDLEYIFSWVLFIWVILHFIHHLIINLHVSSKCAVSIAKVMRAWIHLIIPREHYSITFSFLSQSPRNKVK